MLCAIAALLCLAGYTAGAESPRLWGSRVVGTPSGPSNLMTFRYYDQFAALVVRRDSEHPLTIVNNTCLADGQVWGSPCSLGEGTANITANDVTKQILLAIAQTAGPVEPLTVAYFVPSCNFTPPLNGVIDLRTTFPLSRFVKGQPSFSLDFAVGGAEDDGQASLYTNGTLLCSWMGLNLTRNNSAICTDMEKNTTSNLRIFRGVFPTKSNAPYENFIFRTRLSFLSVSVDYTQSGVSPEVAECNQYWKGGSSTASSATSSSAVTALLLLLLLLQCVGM